MKNKFIKNILGITILEGLVSTAIVGIGFVAILQMVNYSVQSIDVSGERTKANYLVTMIAEDIIGHRDSTYKKFADHLTEGEGEGWEAPDACKREVAGGTDTATNVANIYEGEGNAPENMEAKWDNIISKDRYLKCRGEKDIKKVKVFKVCSWDGCTYSIAEMPKPAEGVSDGYIINYYDEAMYIGRVQINLNNGKKRKFLYFQADYKIKKRETLMEEEEDDGEDEGVDKE